MNARTLLLQSLARYREVNASWAWIGDPLLDLACVWVSMGHLVDAVELLGAIDQSIEAVAPLHESVVARYELALDDARRRLSPDEFERAWRKGHSRTAEEAARVALVRSESEALGRK